MKDLSKLTKAEREAREKRLEYNRRYDALKKAGKWQPKEGARSTRKSNTALATEAAERLEATSSANVYQQINAAIDRVKECEVALNLAKQDLRDLVSSVK